MEEFIDLINCMMLKKNQGIADKIIKVSEGSERKMSLVVKGLE